MIISCWIGILPWRFKVWPSTEWDSILLFLFEASGCTFSGPVGSVWLIGDGFRKELGRSILLSIGFVWYLRVNY